MQKEGRMNQSPVSHEDYAYSPVQRRKTKKLVDVPDRTSKPTRGERFATKRAQDSSDVFRGDGSFIVETQYGRDFKGSTKGERSETKRPKSAGLWKVKYSYCDMFFPASHIPNRTNNVSTSMCHIFSWHVGRIYVMEHRYLSKRWHLKIEHNGKFNDDRSRNPCNGFHLSTVYKLIT